KMLSKTDKEIKTVTSITQTENPDLLLIVDNNGLETIHIHTKQKHSIQVKERSQSEPPLYVNSICVDPSGHYWIGTEGQGLYIYNPKEQTTKSYSKKDGLPNDIIYGILPDDNRSEERRVGKERR